MRVLLQPPTPLAGSLGDQALLRGALSLLGRADLFVPEPYAAEWEGVDPRLRVVSAPDPSDYDEVVLIGADCIDGTYGTPPFALVRQAVDAGIPARVVSCSASGQIGRSASRDIRLLSGQGVQFRARDSVSAARLRAVGISVSTSGDLAFFSPLTAAPHDTARFVEAAKAGGRTVVAVCATDRGIVGDGLERMAAAVLRAPSPAAVVLCHDRRAGGDLSAGRMVAGCLPSDVPVHFVAPADCGEARGVLALADVGISHRLHAAIAGLAEGVPMVTLNLLGKMAGIYRDLGVPWLVAEMSRRLPILMTKALRRLDECRATIQRGLPAMLAGARMNLEGLT